MENVATDPPVSVGMGVIGFGPVVVEAGFGMFLPQLHVGLEVVVRDAGFGQEQGIDGWFVDSMAVVDWDHVHSDVIVAGQEGTIGGVREAVSLSLTSCHSKTYPVV